MTIFWKTDPNISVYVFKTLQMVLLVYRIAGMFGESLHQKWLAKKSLANAYSSVARLIKWTDE